AQVSDYSGWSRTLELQPETQFAGNSFTASTQLDICRIQRLVQAMVDQTGLQRASYSVSLLVPMDVEGEVAGQDFSQQITPRLDFVLDSVQLYLQRDTASQSDPLHWTQAGMLPAATVANRFSILGWRAAVSQARTVAVSGVLIGLLGLAVLAVLLYKATRDD